eukprot:jgi/Tetstr1/459469/TSEL_004836.t1
MKRDLQIRQLKTSEELRRTPLIPCDVITTDILDDLATLPMIITPGYGTILREGAAVYSQTFMLYSRGESSVSCRIRDMAMDIHNITLVVNREKGGHRKRRDGLKPLLQTFATAVPAWTTGHVAFIDPRDWIDYLPRAYAESMPPVGLTNPGLWNPRNDEWDRYLTYRREEARDARRASPPAVLWSLYRRRARGAHGRCGNASREKATARDTADANDLLDSAIRTIATCGHAAEDRLTYLRRFKYKKALTGEERIAERLVYSSFFDTTAAERSNNGVDGLLNALDDKRLEVRLHQAAKAQAAT